jgi:hypothetical protein
MTMEHADGTTGAGHDPGECDVLRTASLETHDLIGEMLDAAASQRVQRHEPRRGRQLADAFMASTCRHLGAVDDVLLPVARRRLPGGRRLVAGYVLHNRELERALHALKARMYGDAHARRLQCSELWPRVRRLVTEHDAHEHEMVDRLTASLDETTLSALAMRLWRIERRSPTRPHPYSPHTGLAGRVSHRVWSVFDEFWDHAEGRAIPYQMPRPNPRRDSLLTRYALGTPRFDDPRRLERGSA